MTTSFKIALCSAALLLGSCAAPESEGLAPSQGGTGAAVKFDIYARPLPEIPIPNDIATRYDATSPTRLRINASLLADTRWERTVRKQLDDLDGWGTFAPITVSFDKPLDPEVIYERHRDDYDPSNDAVYVINVSPDSPDFCEPMPLDMGAGNFPLTLERTEYYPNDFHNQDNQLVFEENEEDANRNGKLDLGEDLDMDGVLDHPNTRHPDGDVVADLMNFYERETNTLILRPIMPMRENTRYAVVLTRRLLDEEGRPVRSPFPYINHTAQTSQLKELPGCLSKQGLGLSDVAFTWSFTTQSITRHYKVVRDGLYGVGPMARLAAEFPAKLLRVFDLKKAGPTVANAKIVTGEEFIAMAKKIGPLIGLGDENDPTFKSILEGQKFIKHHVIFQFESPQFFRRTDGEEKTLPLAEQVWELDPVTGKAFVRSERITVWMTIPRTGTGAKQPAPVAILGHGYTGNKLDPIVFGGYFARQGMATIGVEAVGHGIGLTKEVEALARGLGPSVGLDGITDALLQDRALDMNGDGVKDSGADFWTAYVGHTRDLLRQSAVDYMQLIRILRSFDGNRKWDFDVNKDGTPELAGDFDADGQVDVGGNASIAFTGGSLGGIMGTIIGGVEPQLEATLPISGGGGLADVGIRSTQGGVAEAVNLRMFGPLLVTVKNATTGALELWQYVPDLNDVGKKKVATIPTGLRLKDGDTAVVRNLNTGLWRCARVQAGERVRAAVASDDGDPLELLFFNGALPPSTEDKVGCVIPREAKPYLTIDRFDVDVKFQARTFAKDSPLVAMGDGFGIRRNSPELRRFMTIAQWVLDPTDPVNFAPYFENWLLTFGTGEQVRTRALVFSTIGDMAVPMSTGAAIARAAGFVEFRKRDARWGKTANQVLIDTGAYEATERIPRHLNAAGKSVLQDVEQFWLVPGTNDGYDVPRLNPPLRQVSASKRVGGMTGALFPFMDDDGKHGIDFPDPTRPFDVGTMMVNSIVRYLATDGKEWNPEPCSVTASCVWLPQPPN